MRKLSLLFCVLLAVASGQSLTRDQIYKALEAGKILSPERRLAHFSHTCTLRIGGAAFPVVDVQELAVGGSAPRGANWIVVLDAKLRQVRKISYTSQRPLFCLADKLYVYGDLEIENTMPEGNVLTFGSNGRDVKLSHVEPGDYPLPVTRERKTAPQ